MNNKQQHAARRKFRWSNYQFEALIVATIVAFAIHWINNPTGTKYHDVEYSPCECGPEEFIDSRGVPYYYDTPVYRQIPDDAIGSDTAQVIYEWSYVEPPCDNHLPEEAMKFLPAKGEGGAAMGP